MSNRVAAVRELRLVLVGLSGVGKSAAGNTILGRYAFTSEISSSSVTLTSERREGEVCGRRVTVVDTPGLFNPELSGETLRKEMERCVSLCGAGAHTFLLVIQLGRFTEQEKRVMETLQELFSKRVDQYMVVLFTYGDKLRNKNIDQFISKDTNLQQLLENCGCRYHVFNNEDKDNRSQVPELLQKIDKMVEENQGHCYTNEMRGEECEMWSEEKGTHKPSKNYPAISPTGTPPTGPKRPRVFRKPGLLHSQTVTLRIVLLGKTGVGKSAAANTILGKVVFASRLSSSSVTSQCQKAKAVVDKREEVTVIDTPCLFDRGCCNDGIRKEIEKCISLSSPGPHVFLVVLSLKNRFTQEDQDTVKIIQETIGAESAKYTMVLLTNGDQLKETTIEEFLSGNKNLQQFIDQSHGGYHIFNNEDMANRSQVTELLQKINKMMAANGGGCYTSDMYKKAEDAIEEEKRHRRKEELKRCSEGESQKEKREYLRKSLEEEEIELKEFRDEQQQREARERETKDREARERETKAREARERLAREKAARYRETRERAARDREARERETREREARERETREREARARETRERETRDREARERETKAREARERLARERAARDREARERETREREARENDERAAAEAAIEQEERKSQKCTIL